MHPSRTLACLLLAGATLLAAIVGPDLGSPSATVMFAVMFSALVSSIAGFAFSAVCGGILLHMSDDHVRTVALMVVCSTANQAAMVWSIRNELRWGELPLYVLGGLVGLPIGAWALLHSDPARFAQIVGAVLIAYAGWAAVGGRRVIRLRHPAAHAVVGFLGGVAAASAGLPSLPLTAWCRLQGWDKDQQRALYQPFILLIQLLVVPATVLLAPSGQSAFSPADLLCIPAGLFGTHVGMGCYRGLSNGQFAVAVNVLLVVSGLSFLL